MPLSPPVEREHLHTRRYEFHGYRRADGLWDIEGQMTDVKTYDVPNRFRGPIAAGTPIHDMRIRLTLDDDFTIRDIEVGTEAGPYRICPAIVSRFAAMKGQRIAPGWHARIKQMFGGVNGCIHQAEMLGAMGTVAVQTLFPMRERRQVPTGKPAFLDTCHALASDGDVVREFWPQFYTGS
jgi:hypothetical protein